MKRTPLKRGNSVLKRTGTLKKRSVTYVAKAALGVEESLEQKIFFERIWNPLRPEQRVCYETGERLYGEPLSIYFHHVLPKEVYPQFRYSPWNIILVSFSTHSQYETYPEACPKIYALYQLYKSKIHTLES